MSQTSSNAEIVIRLPRLHDAQREIIGEGLDKPPRFRVVVCGRRFGKSMLAVSEISRLALKTGKPYAYCAPTYRHLAPMWRAFKKTLGPVITAKSENSHRVELYGGGSIDCWSLDNPDAPRGHAYAGMVIDEAALVREGDVVWYGSLRPTLVDYKGWALFISTPRGRNYLYRFYMLGIDPEQHEWQSFRYPTSANPYIPREEIETARELMPSRLFRQEFLAEWLDDESSVFRNVDAASTLSPTSPQELEESAECIMGVDWARKLDYTAVVVIDRRSRRQVYMDRFNRISWTHQVERVAEIAREYNVKHLIYDATGVGDAISVLLGRVQLRCSTEGIQITGQNKANMIESLAVAIERGDLKLLNNPYQISELKAFEMDKLPSGLYRYGAPSGMHDDVIMALALAWQACRKRAAGDWVLLDW
ncbi:MAG: hypothetical protein KatS3mg038_1017 [Candidatus Kapaibacterium sp.]|nr:MAG: hypothetical protein KatS3mg038_1017 [Candidatus Kapabacteria bacterium]